jgi:hypothetical protein
MATAEDWRSPRSASTGGELSPFGDVDFEENLKSFQQQPSETRLRLDHHPGYNVKRDSVGRPLILDGCMRCHTRGECIDNGRQILCLACDSYKVTSTHVCDGDDCLAA